MVKPNPEAFIPEPPPRPKTLKEITTESRLKKPVELESNAEKEFQEFIRTIERACMKEARNGQTHWDYPVKSKLQPFFDRVYQWLKSDDVPYNIVSSDVKLRVFISTGLPESIYLAGTPLLRISWE